MSNQINFKTINKQRLFDKLFQRIQVTPEKEATIAFSSNGVIEKFINDTDFFILAMHEDEFVGGLSSELKNILDEQSVILLATTNEEEAIKAFEEFEGEEVYDGDIPESVEANAPSMLYSDLDSWKNQATHMDLKIVELTADSGEGVHFVAKDKFGNERGEFDPEKNEGSFYNLSNASVNVPEELDKCISILDDMFNSLPDGDLKYILFQTKMDLFNIKKDVNSGVVAEAKAAPEQIKNAEEAKVKVAEIIEKYFPNGKLTHNKGALGGNSTQFFDFSYGKEVDDFPNRVRLNDIMYTSFHIRGFDEDGNVIGKLQLGETGHNSRGLKINSSRVASFNWKNITMNPNKIFERLDNYFKEAKDFIKSEEGQKIMEAYNKSF